MKSINTLPPVVMQIIFGTLATELGRSSGFILRQGKLYAGDFARIFSVYLIRVPKYSLQQLALELSVTASALSQRLQDAATVQFLRLLLLAAVQYLCTVKRSRTIIPILERFKGVYIGDCTTIKLPHNLARHFPGCGGGAKKEDETAAVKVLLRIELSTGQSTQLELDSGRTQDIEMLRKLTQLPKNALEILDLGFFDSDRFIEHNQRGVFWLSRVPARVSVLHKDQWLGLVEWLTQLKDVDRWEGTMSIVQSSPFPCHVMVQRCPAEEAARRRRKLNEHMKKKGKTAGWLQLALCDWWVMATNVPTEKLSMDEAFNLYRARWQIELVFKRWKSLGHVAVPTDLSPMRAQCELYGRLLGVLVVDWLTLLRCNLLTGKSVWQAWQVVHELIPLIIRAIIIPTLWSLVLTELTEKLRRIPKEPKRKSRPSTRQRLLQT
jgi:hypothetical protein